MEIPPWKAKLAGVCSLLSAEHCSLGGNELGDTLFSTPTVTTDGWVTGLLQSSSYPPLWCSSCSHFDLSGQTVFGTFLGVPAKKIYSDYAQLVPLMWTEVFTKHVWMHTSASPNTRGFLPHRVHVNLPGIRRCRTEAGGRESLLDSPWESFISKKATCGHL